MAQEEQRAAREREEIAKDDAAWKALTEEERAKRIAEAEAKWDIPETEESDEDEEESDE